MAQAAAISRGGTARAVALYGIQLAAIVALAFALRAMWLVRRGSDWAVSIDSQLYLALARGLANGCGFAPYSGSCGGPEVMRTPGYPAFLLASLSNYRAAVFVQAVVGAAVCVLVARFGARRGALLAGIAAALFVAVDIPTILESKELMAEAVFQALAAAAIFAALDGVGLLAGVLVGLAALVRPVGELLVPVVAIALLCRNQRRGAIAALAAAIVITGGWAIRNERAAGVFTLTVEGPMNLYSYTAPAVIARHDGVALDGVRASFAAEATARALAARPGAPPLAGANPPNDEIIRAVESYPPLSRFMLRRSLAVMARHPIDTAIITLDGFLKLAAQPYVLQTGWQGFVTNRAALAAIKFGAWAFQAAVLAMLWIGVVRALWDAPRDPERWILLGAALLILLAASPYAVGVSVRYRSPAIPFLAVLAGWGWFRDHRRAPAAALAR